MSDDAPGGGWLQAGSTDAGEVAGVYDGWAEQYDDDLAAWSYRAPEVVARQVVRRVPDATVVLDAGCGTGLVGRALRAEGYAGEIHGFDVSEASLLVAERAAVYSSLRAADLQRPFELPDDDADALVCVGVMTYLPDVETTWREFARVVRPGGIVAATQREDLWEERRCAEIVERLAADGTWTPLELTGPQPYLPDNPDDMADVRVHYVVAQVA